MTRVEYINCLAQKLKRLPKEDYDRAMAYFEEYFEEAGPENEQQAIEDLGSPEAAADQLIIDLAIQNTEEPPKNMKKGLSAVWIGLLALCAAPIALPFAFALAALAFSFVLVVICVIGAFFISVVAFAAAGLLSVIGGIVLLFTSPVNGLASFGFGLMTLGFGILTGYGCIVFCKWFLSKVSKWLGKIAKGGKKHEKKH